MEYDQCKKQRQEFIENYKSKIMCKFCSNFKKRFGKLPKSKINCKDCQGSKQIDGWKKKFEIECKTCDEKYEKMINILKNIIHYLSVKTHNNEYTIHKSIKNHKFKNLKRPIQKKYSIKQPRAGF